MPTDLSNREGQIFDYLKEVLKRDFPEADLRDDGEFMEMFGLPHIKLFEPLMTFIDRLKLMQSLENAENMTEEEMDEVAFSHYVSREMGERASGYVTLIFEDFPTRGPLVIPAGIEAVSKAGARFQSSETVTLTETTLASYYDPSSFSYRIPVPFTAAASGSSYNVPIGDITSLSRAALPNLVDVINETRFSGGTDRETNRELANRIHRESFSPNLGNKRGYKSYIDSYAGVRESLIAGFGHPLMKRDVIGEVEAPGVKFHKDVRDLHWGTKIDVYVRGEKLVEQTEYLKAEKDEDGQFIVRLNAVPVSDVVEVRLHAVDSEFDDPNLDLETLYITDYSMVKEEDFETEGTVYEKTKLILTDDRISEGRYIRVVYRHNELIPTIQNALYEGEDRSPTADVKIKEANKKFLFGAIIASMKTTMGMKDTDRSVIRQRMDQWVNQLPMGAELQFSDLQEPIYASDVSSDEGIVDYIHLPYQFIITENNDRYIYYCLSEKQRNVIENLFTSSPFIKKVFERYRDFVTTYDFFDMLHAFTHDNGFEDSIRSLQFRTGVVAAVAQLFPRIRDMALVSRATKRLSPPKHEIAENEYFDFGETYVYESKPYVENDWEKMAMLFWNIATKGENTEDTRNLFYLAVYVLSVMYVVTTDEVLEEPVLLQRFIKTLTDRTPVEFESNL